MNLKKLVASVIIVFLLVGLMMSQIGMVKATVATTPMFLGITDLRMQSDPNLGYSIGDPNSNQETGSAAKIWNIVQYSSATSQDPTEGNIYCLRAGLGFSNTTEVEAYNLFYDMIEERDVIGAQDRGEVLQNLVKGTQIELEDGSKIERYDAILAIIDMFYIHKGQNSETEKTKLLERAGIYADEWDAVMTVDEVKAIQQAALWYFTNYGEEDGKYDKTDDNNWLWYTENGTDYSNLYGYDYGSDESPELAANSWGTQRQEQAEILYNYLIRTAKENANNYSVDSETNEVPAQAIPAKVETTKLESTVSGSNTIIGPIKITENELSSLPYTIDMIVKNNGSKVDNYTLLDDEKQPVNGEVTVEDLVGQDFYISLPGTTTNEISVDITINYTKTKMTLWTASDGLTTQQPVVIPTRTTPSETFTLKTTPQKVFDLALRKYITVVNNTELSGTSSRVPVIDTSTLSSNTTTATYKHKKDPVVISTGDKVTYKLTIYNEGEKAGRATKIVDQLPTGLKFLSVQSGNFELGSYNETGDNTLTLVRKSSNTDNLAAYTEGNLASETIEIICEVTAKPDAKNSKILTNVAWIAEEYDAEDNVTITNQQKADRDSEPETKPYIDANTTINKDNMSNYTGNGNKNDLTDKDFYYKGYQDDDDFEKLVLMPESFDLKLIKRITAVNNQNVPERIESIDASKLNVTDSDGNITATTATYNLNKEPVSVKKGDIVTYTFRIYNEGTLDGYAQEITEDIPEGLEFIWSEKTGDELAQDTTLTEAEKEAVTFNQNYLWGNFVYDDEKENIIQISTDYLSQENETTVGGNLIEAFGKNDGTKTEADLDYKEVSVMLKVVSENITGTIIKNEAAISEDCDENGDPIDDRDSDTEIWTEHPDPEEDVEHEDDEDHDFIILKTFDLALRKFITAVSSDETIDEDEYLKESDGSYTRAPQVDTSELETHDEDGNLITTAIYNHSKEPVEVKKGDYVIYMLRVYNESEIDGYAAEIKDHLPSYLEFVDNEFNEEYSWEASEDGKTVTTTHLADTLINKATKNTAGEIVLTYKEVPIMCRVTDDAITGEKITNIADITKYLDDTKQPIIDRDSTENNVVLPNGEQLPSYKDDETGEYIPGQEDDDDFEKVIIKKFDLALRKFITKIEDKAVNTRIPEVKFENGKITYEHDKTPLQVVTGNTVIYTIRVYNEGEVDGFVEEITDDIPAGLEFLPENELNQTMRWKMIDEEGNETEDVTKAVKITTDYLSKAQDEDNLLHAFDPNADISESNPEYRDVQVAFEVTEPNSSDKIIINSAQISEDADKNGDPVDDEDSIPDEWNEGEDDQDKEYIKLVEFDLALRKWVTQAIVIENGETTITETGHQPYDDPEQVVKVELHRKKLNQVTVKFRYSIRVINEGEIAGYAKEVTDYVPQGLKFVAEDNQGWTDEGNNVISTRLLENTLLQPGEYADVEVVLTWVNSQDNMGVMVNTAEISEDDNEFDAPDKDSTPDNQKPGEDDIDDAPVMLTVSTGQMRIYFTLGFIVLITIASGVVLIKKFVL